MDSETLIKQADLQKITTEGSRIYDRIKPRYEPQDNGKFLAIEIDEEKEYLGNSSADAVELARHNHPNKVFYVVKIGFDVAETMAQLFSGK